MRALIFHEPGRVVLESLPDPAPGPGEALLRVAAAGVCASDLRVFRGEKHAERGVIPGHEFAGTVVAVGSGVDTLAVDDRVAVYPLIVCGGCDYCRRGLRNRCVQRRTLGYDLNGGLAEFVLLPAALVHSGHAVPLDPALSFARASLSEPLACVLNSLETCRLRAGGTVAVLGAGPMGLMHVILARALGAGPIVVSEPVAARREFAEPLGATAVVGDGPGEFEAAVKDASGGQGADVVVVTAGLAGLTEIALPLAAKQAVINLFAGFPLRTTATLDVNQLHYNEIFLTGTQNATADQFRRSVALLPALSQIEQVVSHCFAMQDATQAYTTRSDAGTLKTMILPIDGEPEP